MFHKVLRYPIIVNKESFEKTPFWADNNLLKTT